MASGSHAKQILPKVIWEERIARTQLCNIGYNGMPQNHPKLPLPFDNYHPHVTNGDFVA